MKKFIIYSVIVILAARESHQVLNLKQTLAKATKFKLSIVPDYEHYVPQHKHDCADNILYDYHHKHPDATRFLLQFQDVRRFFMNSFHHCNSLPLNAQQECRATWKQSVADELNLLSQDANDYDAENADQWLEDIKERTVNCLTIGQEHNSFKLVNIVKNITTLF